MKTKTTLSVSDARKNIFEIIDEVQKPNVYYTLTERGKPKAVILSAEKFEYLAEKRNKELSETIFNIEKKQPGRNHLLADKAKGNYIFENSQVFPRVFIVRDESRIVYLSQAEEDLKRRREELVKAQLYVKLIENLKYPLNLVELGRYVKVGGRESKRYIEADIIVNDDRGNVEVIFEVSSFDEYEKNLDTNVSNLFGLADSLSWIKKPKYLIYFSQIFKNGRMEEKITVIDYIKFSTFSSWKKAGRPAENIIPTIEIL